MSLPECIKPYKRFLVQANLVSKVDPLVGYYCRLYAASKLIELPKEQRADKTAAAFITGLFNNLEKEKAKLELDKEADKDKYLDFVKSVFDNADSDDRAGEATQATSQAFMSAFVLYEASAVFGEETLNAEVKQKIKYAKWKAVDIAKAIKEGRKPKPGGADEDFGNYDEFMDGDDSAGGAKPAAGGTSAPSSSKGATAPPPAAAEDEEEDEKGPPPELPSPPAAKVKPKPAAKAPLDRLPSKGKIAKAKALGVKDMGKIEVLNRAEEQTREALSAIRFNDVSTALDKLNAAIATLKKA